jgi:hypothetical protein
LEGSLFLTRESELIKGFLFASFQYGLLVLQLLLIGQFTAVGVGQQVHALLVGSQQSPFAFLQLAVPDREGLVGEDELLAGKISLFTQGVDPRGITFIRAQHLCVEIDGQG